MTAPNIVDVADIKGKSTPLTPLTTTSTNIVANQASSNSVYKINSIVVTNIDGTNAADVTVDFDRSGTPYAIVKTVSVPADASLVVMSKETSVYLQEGDTIKAYASANDDLCIAVSYEIISDQEIVLSSTFDEAASLGAPSATYAQNDTFTSPSGTTDETYAFDINALSTSDYGVILGLGGTASGTTLMLESDDNKIYVSSPNGVISGSFSPYYGQSGTLYFTINYGSTGYVYWWDGTTMNLIVSGSFTSDYSGGNAAEIGNTTTDTYNVGTTHDLSAFTGTITEARVWNNTYFDFSTV
jgi:hypothetical protein